MPGTRRSAAGPLQARRRRLLPHPRHPGHGRTRVHARRPRRRALRHGDQRGPGPPARRSVRRHRSRGSSVDLPALGFGRDRRAAMTIVGVIGNERVRSDLRAPIEDVAYVPIAQAPRMQVKLAVRTLRRRCGRWSRRFARPCARSRAGWRWPTSARWRRSGRGSLSGVTRTRVARQRVRRGVRAAGRARPLRRAGAHRGPAAARDRHPHGPRRRRATTCWRWSFAARWRWSASA